MFSSLSSMFSTLSSRYRGLPRLGRIGSILVPVIVAAVMLVPLVGAGAGAPTLKGGPSLNGGPSLKGGPTLKGAPTLKGGPPTGPLAAPLQPPPGSLFDPTVHQCTVTV